MRKDGQDGRLGNHDVKVEVSLTYYGVQPDSYEIYYTQEPNPAIPPIETLVYGIGQPTS